MFFIKIIPNLLTLSNLLCGFLGILYSYQNDACSINEYFFWLALVFDFLDGFAARLLKTTSSFGKQLDSLADLCSFGILPGVMLFFFLSKNLDISYNSLNMYFERIIKYFPYTSLVIPFFATLRLAKFNIDSSQSYSFKGIPTPANALLFISIASLDSQSFLYPYFTNVFSIIPLCILCSIIMFSNIEFFSLKFHSFSIANNKFRYFFIFISILLVLKFHREGIIICLIFYILICLSLNFIKFIFPNSKISL